MNNDADPKHRPERIKQKKSGMGGWAFPIEKIYTDPSKHPHPSHTPPFSFSRKALLTNGRGVYGMEQHTYIALIILNSKSPTLSVTFQHLISFR